MHVNVCVYAYVRHRVSYKQGMMRRSQQTRSRTLRKCANPEMDVVNLSIRVVISLFEESPPQRFIMSVSQMSHDCWLEELKVAKNANGRNLELPNHSQNVCMVIKPKIWFHCCYDYPHVYDR